MTEPKRIGRPPSTDPFKALTIQLRASELAGLDRVRGDVSRPMYLRRLLLDVLAPRSDPVEVARVRAPTVEKIERAFGPVKSAPGARLKK